MHAKTEVIGAYVDPAVARQVERYAHDNYMNKSEVLRYALEQLLGRPKKKVTRRKK